MIASFRFLKTRQNSPSLAFLINFCPIQIDLSGNTVWPQASGFQKPILAFFMNFCPNCKRSSLRSQCCKMRHFLWFSNTVVGKCQKSHAKIGYCFFWENLVAAFNHMKFDSLLFFPHSFSFSFLIVPFVNFNFEDGHRV